MRRAGIVLPIIALSVLFSSAAFAAVSFKNVTGTVTDGEFGPARETARVPAHGSLYITFVEIGLGSNAGTNYLVTANATAIYVCLTNGGQTPNAANKERNVMAGSYQPSACTGTQDMFWLTADC